MARAMGEPVVRAIRKAGDWTRERLGRLPLFWKLLAPGLVVAFVLGVVILFVTVRLSAQQADRELDTALERESLTARAAVRDAEFQVVQAARATALLDGLSEAIHDSDTKALADLFLGTYVLRFRLDLLAATDAAGAGLFQLSGPNEAPAASTGGSWAEYGPVRRALPAGEADDREISSGITTVGGEGMFLAVAPVRHPGEAHAEFVVAGVSVDRALRAGAPNRRTVFALYGPDGALLSASGTAPTDRIDGSVLQPARMSSSIGGRDYVTRVDPLAPKDPSLGTLSVSVPRASAATFARSTGLRLLAIVVLGLAGLAVLYTLIARAAVGQIRGLGDVARRLGHGELSARAQGVGSDELGELALGINHMAEELEAVQHEIERRVATQTAELRRLHARSEQAFERQAEALALISHEFRNPIFAILGHAELMVDRRLQPDDDAWTVEFGTTIKGAAEELLRHVNDILAFSRSRATQERLALEAIDVGRELDGLAPTLRALARRADIALTIDVAKGIPAARANRDAVRDVVLNLVANAVKYTPPEGSVDVVVRSMGGRVVVSIRDTGVGIAPEEHRAIFEPFYRVEGVRAMRGQLSTGLGLALTERLVKAMGGTVAVESEVGAGSTFTVSLPRAKAGASAKNGARNGSRTRSEASAG